MRQSSEFQTFTTKLCWCVCVCVYERRGHVQKKVIYLCFQSPATLKYFFYFIDLNIILIYQHISFDTSIYWPFRHLWACRCLINSVLVWLNYLRPVFLFVLVNCMAAVRMLTNLIIHLQPLSPHSAEDAPHTLPILSLEDTFGFSSLRGNWRGRQGKRLTELRNVGSWLLSELNLLYSPSNSVWINSMFNNCRDELGILVFHENGILLDWQSE